MFQSVTSAEGPVKKVVLVHDVALQRVELEKLVCTSIVLKLWGRNKAVHARVQRYREHHMGVFTVTSHKLEISTTRVQCMT